MFLLLLLKKYAPFYKAFWRSFYVFLYRLLKQILEKGTEVESVLTHFWEIVVMFLALPCHVLGCFGDVLMSSHFQNVPYSKFLFDVFKANPSIGRILFDLFVWLPLFLVDSLSIQPLLVLVLVFICLFLHQYDESGICARPISTRSCACVALRHQRRYF